MRYPDWVAYEPALVPPPALMADEGITVLEDWFRWAEEWSMLLRVYGGLTRSSRILEIGCGLGRVAFPLRYVLDRDGTYLGFEIVRRKVEFLQQYFHPAHPNFQFVWADVQNAFYNPTGEISPTEYRFPVESGSQDIVYAASVFTHMRPEYVAHYICESARALRPGGRCVFSFFLLDHYRRGAPRPSTFARSDFDFEHHLEEWGEEFAFAHPNNPEQMTAYRTSLLARFASESRLATSPAIPGLWSGFTDHFIGAQDLLVLEKRP